jgi:two-component system response regulator AtoC
MKTRILLIDDDAHAHDAVRASLNGDCDVAVAATAKEGLAQLGSSRPDAVLLDLLTSEEDGMAVLRTVRRDYPDIPVIMLSGLTTARAAVTALKLGAEDYLTKPCHADELRAALARIMTERSLTRELARCREEIRGRHAFHQLIGKSAAMQEIYTKIELVADTRTSVLITGESGTGKELVARALHYNSARRNRPFIGINCAAIPETLLENEFFGHEKGAFTDARTRQTGQFELANGGTLFLDEVSELSLTMQAKLLRVLQEREFRRIGGVQPIKVDVRLIAATNRDLDDLLQTGQFREDMYYRINVVSLFLPPLRDRRQDIPLLAHHFLAKSCVAGKRKSHGFSKEALDLLIAYGWPGNVRELENAVEQAGVWCGESQILPDHLPVTVRTAVRGSSLRYATLSGEMSLVQAVVRFEREIILEALKRRGFVQTQTAALLGITRRQLKYRMDALGLRRSDPERMKEADCAS